MNRELEKALKELKRVTGVTLSVEVKNEKELEHAIMQLRALSGAYKEKNNKDYIIKKWMMRVISEDEFLSLAKKFHIPVKEKTVLYLISMAKGESEAIMEILKNLFPNNSNIWILPVNENKLVLLYHFYRKEPDAQKIAYEILETLNAEALVRVKISYSETLEHLRKLPDAYEQACFAMEVGEIFYCNQYVYGHNTLGIGRLLYDVDEKLCEEYICEKLSRNILEKPSTAFEPDILHTVNCFLDNNLKIAETARQLHVHRNTLLYRLEQIEKETGLDVRQFHHAMTYKMASMVLLKLSEGK